MIRNLFSVFDPSTTVFNFSLNWLRTWIVFLTLPLAYWLVPSRLSILWNNIVIILHREFKVLLGISSLTVGGTLIFISLFRFILFNNFLGLFPYIFTSSSHLRITLSLALPLWLRFMLFGWVNYTLQIFAHLVPQGTPPGLIPFIVCIETIRNIIRPGTLAIRLTANIIAGHLLITLLGSTGSRLRATIVRGLLVVQIALLTLESAVSVIQSYVFAVLRTLYAREVV